GRSVGRRLEALLPADDALCLEPLPDDVAVLLRLAPDLVEDRFDVQELERRLPTALQGLVEALVHSAIEPRRLAADGQHVDANDEQVGLREPRLMLGRVAA